MALFFNANSQKVNPRRVAVAVITLIALLFAGLLVNDEKISETSLDCFKILFAAVVGLFGFEAGKFA